MPELNASLVTRLYKKVGAALELASTTENDNEQAYWLGMADCAVELIAEETSSTYDEVKNAIKTHYEVLSLADRVDGAFNERSN